MGTHNKYPGAGAEPVTSGGDDRAEAVGRRDGSIPSTGATPGPWEADGLSIRHADGTQVALVNGYRADQRQTANAAIIAAAPDLYEALRDAHRVIDYLVQRLEEKNVGCHEWAEGETERGRSALSRASGGADRG